MTLILTLTDNKEAALKAIALSQGVSAEQFVQRIVDRELENVPLPVAEPPRRRHISEVVRDIMSDVPREVFETLPRDGAREHDHYLYGSPKHGE